MSLDCRRVTDLADLCIEVMNYEAAGSDFMDYSHIFVESKTFVQ